MGTRHLIVVIYKGRWCVAQYGQFDGYPEGAGMELVKLLASPDFVKKIRDGFAHTYEPDAEEFQALVREITVEEDRVRSLPRSDENRFINEDLLRSFREDPVAAYTPEILKLRPSLLRNTSSAILVLIANATAENPLPLYLEAEFANDGLYCEWAYVVDLDSEVLEIYGGGSYKTPGHRFAHLGGDKDSVPCYIASVPFADLDGYKTDSDAFIGVINQKTDELNKEQDAEDEKQGAEDE